MCKECTKFGPTCERGRVLLERLQSAVKTTSLKAVHGAYKAYSEHVEGEPGPENEDTRYEYKNEQEEERCVGL